MRVFGPLRSITIVVSSLVLACGTGIWPLESGAAHRAGRPLPELTLRVTPPLGERREIQIFPLENGRRGVEIVFKTFVATGKTDETRKSFGPAVYEELRRSWGLKPFSITFFKSDVICHKKVVWFASNADNHRRICKRGPELTQLARLYSAVQSLMLGGA